MWKSRHPKHCTDEVLLGHLDGELSLRARHAVKRHLATCWECRAHLRELEDQAEAASRLLSQQNFQSPQSIRQAKSRFQDRRQNFEKGLFLRPQFVEPKFSWTTRLSIAFASITIFVGGAILAWWLKPTTLESKSSPPSGIEILARTAAVEQSQTTGVPAVHQKFRVEIQPIKPQGAVCVRELDVWSEAKMERYAARFTAESGRLQDAVWRPDPNKGYVYSSGAALRTVSASTLTSNVRSIENIAESGVSPEQLQDGFLKWLTAQHWQPVSFTSEVRTFIAESGVNLRAENVPAADGGELIRLTARRESEDRRVEVVVDIDKESYRPLAQTIRFEIAGQIAEMRFTSASTEQLTAAEVLPELFEPDANLIVSRKPPLPEPVADPPRVVTAPSLAELAALEVEVLHRLDQVGAVLGEQVSVSRPNQGKILVQGAVETQQRKQEILGALTDFQSNPAVELQISTVAEATDAEEQMSQAAGGRVILQELELNKKPTPVFAQLRQLFSETEQSKLPKNARSQLSEKEDEQIRQFAKKTLDESQQALLHAWALRHFVERFSPEEQSAMPAETQAKWRALIREHADGFRRETVALRTDLQPVFYPGESGSTAKEAEGAGNAATSIPTQNPGDLQEAALAQAIYKLFELAASHDEALRMAFVLSTESQSLEKIKSTQFLKSLKDSEALAAQLDQNLAQQDVPPNQSADKIR